MGMSGELTLGEVVCRQICAVWWVEAEQSRRVADVRTLHDHFLAGSDPAPVRLSGAAEFPAALQRGADAAGADRSPGRRTTAVRVGALGVDSALGQGPAEIQPPHQCALRVRARHPAFRNAMRRRRCLVPADGFYAWKEEGGRK